MGNKLSITLRLIYPSAPQQQKAGNRTRNRQEKSQSTNRPTENLLNRITSDPENGKPIIQGMRITTGTVLYYPASGETTENILEAYPVLEKEDLLACLEFAKKIADKSILTYDHKAS